MLIRQPDDVNPSEITPESAFVNRRQILQQAGIVAASATALPALALPSGWVEERGYVEGAEIGEEITPSTYAYRYNNFYEFGTDKRDPSRYADRMTVDPWSVEIAGLFNKTGTVSIEELLKGVDLEERIYRLRCVEAWSMVIPWVGFPVKKILDKFEPLGSAKYVQFTTALKRDEMPGVRSFFSSIDFPYVEGLRLDEANHPLCIFAVGMYGKVMPNQNGAPFRLVVPWKYGFKSIKSIVKIELTERQPKTTWNVSAANEYGFYANVNPTVNHPRWSQATERRLPSGLFSDRIDTRMFNGYDEVASLYEGMNLRRYY